MNTDDFINAIQTGAGIGAALQLIVFGGYLNTPRNIDDASGVDALR